MAEFILSERKRAKDLLRDCFAPTSSGLAMTSFRESSVMKKGRIFVISSPSGGGKTTILSAFKKGRFDIEYSVSMTTRKKRRGEEGGKEYNFLKQSEFKRLIARKRFLEWADNFGELYGTPKDFVTETIKRGRDIILSIDVKGAMQVKKIYKNAVLIFLLPPSIKDLKRRLTKRSTEDKETVARRLKAAKKELTYLNRYDYTIVNDNLEDAVDKLKFIIKTERGK